MSESHYYEVYGLRLCTNRPLVGLIAQSGSGRPHVEADLAGELPAFISATARSYTPPTERQVDPDAADVQVTRFTAAGQTFLSINYTTEHPIEFVVDTAGSRIWSSYPSETDFGDVASLFAGSILGRALRLWGVPSLHAGSVAVDGRAVAIVGQKGSGKSSFIAACAAEGFAVLADDVTAIREEGNDFLVQPGPARLRLGKPALDSFFGSRDLLPRVLSHRNKRYLDLTGDERHPRWRFHPSSLPLGAIYFLGARSPAQTTPAVEAIRPIERLLLLTANTYGNEIADRQTAANELGFWTRVLRTVPMRRVVRPDDFALLARTRDIVLADFRNRMRLGVA